MAKLTSMIGVNWSCISIPSNAAARCPVRTTNTEMSTTGDATNIATLAPWHHRSRPTHPQTLHSKTKSQQHPASSLLPSSDATEADLPIGLASNTKHRQVSSNPSQPASHSSLASVDRSPPLSKTDTAQFPRHAKRWQRCLQSQRSHSPPPKSCFTAAQPLTGSARQAAYCIICDLPTVLVDT